MRLRRPDLAKARSILQEVEKRMPFLLDLPITDASAAIIVTNIYELFRMLGDALLTVRGKEATRPDPHTQMIEELFALKVTTARPLQALLNLKDIRHKINYRGYHASTAEATDAVDLAQACYEAVLTAIRNEITELAHSPRRVRSTADAV